MLICGSVRLDYKPNIIYIIQLFSCLFENVGCARDMAKLGTEVAIEF